MTSTTRTTARRASRSPVFRGAARVGFVVAGILNAAVGVLAISVAVSGASGSADQAGAMQQLATLPGGQVLIWVIALGLLALGVWNGIDAFLVAEQDRRRRWAARAKGAGKAIAYVALGVLAIRTALGGASGGGSSEEQLTAGLLSTPGGVLLVVLVGLGALGIGGYLVAKGWRRKFLDDLVPMSGRTKTVTVVVGTVGYVARGIAIAVIGGLFLAAAVTADASQAGGLDDALAVLAGLPFGQVLLIAIGAGFLAYGVYCVVRARFADL